MATEMDAGQRADGAAKTYHDLTALGGGQGAQELRPELAPERLEPARPGRIVAQKTARGPHGAEREACPGDDRAIPHLTELQAGAAEVRDDAVRERQAPQGRVDTELRFVARTQDPHFDPLMAAERVEQPLGVAGIPHGRRRHGNDTRALAVSRVTCEE